MFFIGVFNIIVIIMTGQNMSEIIIFLEGSVVPKPRPRVTSRGTYLPHRYLDWRKFAEAEIYKQLMEKYPLSSLPIQRASVQVLLAGKHRMSSDADNLIGACLDAMVSIGLLKNDNLSCVPEISLRLVEGEENGAYIILSPLPPAQTKTKAKRAKALC